MAKKAKNSRRTMADGWYDHVLWKKRITRDNAWHQVEVDLSADRRLIQIYIVYGGIEVRVYQENGHIYLDSTGHIGGNIKLLIQKMTGAGNSNARQTQKSVERYPCKLTSGPRSQRNPDMAKNIEFSLDEIQQAQELIKLMGKGL